MNYQTELMRSILTNKKAQEIIDFVSPKYGKSYVGLWIFQAIGTVLDDACEIAESMRYETNPTTAELLMDQWEDHYGLPRDASLTMEQRQSSILSRLREKGACNPARIANAVSSALGGIAVEIQENVAKNTFLVEVQGGVTSIAPAVAALERMKPAHTIYEIRGRSEIEADGQIFVAAAMTQADMYALEVKAYSEIPVETNVIVAAAMTHNQQYQLEVQQ